jgi:Tfp pilus assembly protein FimT
MRGSKTARGFTTLEILAVVAILGFIIAIAIAAFPRYMQSYRLSTVTRRVASAITLARLKAVSTNMNYTFTLDANVTPNRYQITGTTDINANGVAEPWEDMFGTAAIENDTVYDSAQSLDSPSIGHNGVANLPNGSAMSLAMDPATSLSIVFNGRGVVRSMKDDTDSAKEYILIQSQGLTNAIFVDDTGMVRLYKNEQSGWTEMN